jgi:hypothetical protein
VLIAQVGTAVAIFTWFATCPEVVPRAIELLFQGIAVVRGVDGR